LLGRPFLGRVEAHKAGHALHTQLVSRLLADPSLWTETVVHGSESAPEQSASFPPSEASASAD